MFMDETTTFYRVHLAGRDAVGPLAFCADNAYSALWGATFVDGDPGRTVCPACDGEGEWDDSPCRACGGEGVEDLQRGYSCCKTGEDLVDYFSTHGTPCADDDVVVFEGRRTGNGFDGEPLAIPTGEVRWMTWAEFTATVSA